MEEQQSQLVIYQTPNGDTQLDVRFFEETVWLTQKQMSELFQTTTDNIGLHLKNIYNEGELIETSTTEDFLVVQTEGSRQVRRQLKHYNLDAIISVGYRVQSVTATKFRQWATKHLREYLIKGFVMDDERLKNPDLPFDYFDELLRRIQDIRTSERRFYQKITDIYATSVDYDPNSELSLMFFKTVQNKMHWAITGHTAAELVYKRADASKINMGLTSWRGMDKGYLPKKSEVSVAKNYLNEDELAALNNLTEQYLVFAESQAMRRIPMTMKDWLTKLDGFLTLNDRDILTNAGSMSHKVAKKTAEKQYELFKQNELAKPKEVDKLLADISSNTKKIKK